MANVITYPPELRVGDQLISGHYVVSSPREMKGFIEVELKTPGGAKTTQTFNPKQRLYLK